MPINYEKDKTRLCVLQEENTKKLEALHTSMAGLSGDELVEKQAGFDVIIAENEAMEAQISNICKLQDIEDKMETVAPDANNDGQVPTGQPVQRFETFGEQLQAVMRAGLSGGQMDPRLHIGAITGMSETSPADGGFLVQTDFSAELLKNIFSGGQIASRVRKIPIGANSNGLKMNAVNETSRATGSRWGGIRGYWLAEGGTKTKSAPKLRQIELNLKKLIGLLYATDELLQDATALEGVITQAFQEEFQFLVEDAVIRGTGAGQPLGILNSPCLVTITKETGQAADTILAANIEKMFARAPAKGLSNSAFFMNQDCWPQIFQLHHVVGTGGVPMFIRSGGLGDAPGGTLLGLPIVPIEYADTVGNKGDIILADFSQYLMIDKGAPKQDSSIHVQFTTDETTFRFVYRVDGQPIPNSPITPYKGDNTQSPFIVLAAR